LPSFRFGGGYSLIILVLSMLALYVARPVVLMRASSGADRTWPWLDTPGERP